MNKLLKEFLSYILVEAESVSSKQAKKMGLKNISGPYWSQSGQSPATHKSEGDKIVPVGKNDQPETPVTTKTSTDGKKRPSTAPNTQRQPIDTTNREIPPSIQSSTKNLPGAKGVLNAVVGITEKGSAGAGSKESRAAEASVVVVTHHLLGLRKSSDTNIDEFLLKHQDEITSMLTELSNMKGSKLKGDWVNAVNRQIIGSLSTVEKRFGSRIQDVVWDNEEGRTTVGLKKKNRRDRSDMYVKLQDGRVIGVSLKKDGNVFLANQGYAATMDDVSALSTTSEAKAKMQELKGLHKEESRKKTSNILKYTLENSSDIAGEMSKLTREQMGKSVESSEYDFLFDEKSGKIKPDFIQLFTSAAEKFKAGGSVDPLRAFTRNEGFGEKRFKLLMKSLATLADSPDTSGSSQQLKKLLLERRDVDRQVTQQFIKTIQTDSDVKKSVTAYMLDILDIPQTLSNRPFEGVSNIVTTYGEGTVDEQGNTVPMVVDDRLLKKALGIAPDASSKEAARQLEERFIIDAEADEKVGFVRLRMTNTNPPPNYFYPTIATLGIRARGLDPAVFELHQHDSWTATLMNGNANPASWNANQKKKNAKETIKFLTTQMKNPVTTDEQRTEIEKDIDFYKKLLPDTKKSGKK